MSSPSSSCSCSARGSGGLPWALLDRVPRLAELGALASEETDVLLDVVPPPGVSTAFLHPHLLPDDSAGDASRCRVEGVDASGLVLIGFPSPRAPTESHLLVCRPLPVPGPSSGGGGAKAMGKARFLPAVPEGTLGHGISTAHPAGIITDRGDNFFVAQLKTSHSSTPVVAFVLCFSSDHDSWAVKEVVGDDRWHGFGAKSVVSHDRGVQGDGRLVFVDIRRGLLLFHPRLTDSHFLQFPDGGGRAAVDATVDSTEGRIVYVLFYDVPEGTMVGLWWLQEEEQRWFSHHHMPSDEPLLPVRGVRSVGPVDPTKMTRIVFAFDLGRPDGDGVSSSYCFEVTPAGILLQKLRFFGDAQSMDCAVCPLHCTAPKRTWTAMVNNAVQEGKEAGLKALHAVQTARKYADELPGAVEMVGGAFGLPYAGTMLTAAKVIKAANTSFGIMETTTSWVSEHGPPAPPVWDQYAIVGTEEEARRAIQFWKDMGMPAGLEVEPAPGLTLQQVEELRRVFIDAGAESLVNKADDYVLVDRAPQF